MGPSDGCGNFGGTGTSSGASGTGTSTGGGGGGGFQITLSWVTAAGLSNATLPLGWGFALAFPTWDTAADSVMGHGIGPGGFEFFDMGHCRKNKEET